MVKNSEIATVDVYFNGEGPYEFEVDNSKTEYMIVDVKYIHSEKNFYGESPFYVWCKDLDGFNSRCVIMPTKEAFDEINIGDIYDASSEQFVPMTEDVLDAIATNKNSFPYHLLSEQYRNDSRILCNFLNSFDPYTCEHNARIPYDLCNPISYALPGALTDENMKLAIEKGLNISFKENQNGKECQEKFINWLYRNYSLSKSEYESIKDVMFFSDDKIVELTKKASRRR